MPVVIRTGIEPGSLEPKLDVKTTRLWPLPREMPNFFNIIQVPSTDIKLMDLRGNYGGQIAMLGIVVSKVQE